MVFDLCGALPAWVPGEHTTPAWGLCPLAPTGWGKEASEIPHTFSASPLTAGLQMVPRTSLI